MKDISKKGKEDKKVGKDDKEKGTELFSSCKTGACNPPMKDNLTKKYPAIGCCGIDCGLCPRYHTDGKSKCPGCVGMDFFAKHPSCSIITCCVKNNKLETCADCMDFPCGKIKNWDSADSFVTHKNSLVNLQSIRENGLPAFIRQQNARIALLERFIKQYDDGRSKSFFCLALSLLPINDIKTALQEITYQKNKLKSISKNVIPAEAGIHNSLKSLDSRFRGSDKAGNIRGSLNDKKSIAKMIKNILQQIAKRNGIELIYRNKMA